MLQEIPLKRLSILDLARKCPKADIADHRTIFIDENADIEIGEGAILEPFIILKGKIRVGKNCVIRSFTTLKNTTAGDNCEIGGHIEDSCIGNNTEIGRLAEIKRSLIGNRCNIKHHCYLGDVKMGNNVNVGAGYITANFDGENKNETIIEDGAFLGVNSSTIAPCKIGREALVAAGSTIAGDVPPNALAITRAAQIIKEKFWEKAGRIWRRMKK